MLSDIHERGVGRIGLICADGLAGLENVIALVFPSHYDGEGCPGILVEALSASLPIIASDWKYNSEFVVNGDNGFLCDAFLPSAYIDAIKVLLTNKTLRRRMAMRSYERSRDFSASQARTFIERYLNAN